VLEIHHVSQTCPKLFVALVLAICCLLFAARAGLHLLLDAVASLRQRLAQMAYMLLMMEPVGQRQARTKAEGREAYASMVRWSESLQERGLLIATESLRSLTSAKRVRLEGGRPHITDGPFVETKEMIGGFFLVNCETVEEAVALASECPAAAWLTVEVRGLSPCSEESGALQ